MRRLRPWAPVWLALLFSGALAGALATTVSGSHAEQKWAGFWHFTHLNSPTTGLQGGFALQHRTDEQGAELLESIGGIACPEPTDYFIGAYTVPDSEDLPPNSGFNDTGKFRGCTVGDRLHLRGRYESNSNPNTVAGDFELVLMETDLERWNGTFTTDGAQDVYTWTGFFQGHFDDGADEVSDPPYTDAPEEPEPPPSGPQQPAPVASEVCNRLPATVTPNPDAPAGLAISGTDRDDVIVGTDGPDRILGLGGNDTICGFGGDDEIIGGDGEDYVEGGLGNDTVNGDAGKDFLAGDYSETNLLSPNGGNDHVSGGDGDDWIEGGAGNDELSGGEGEDTIWGNIRERVFFRINGFPSVVGADDDKLFGDGGKDKLEGGRGTDVVDGGSGDDRLYGGAGSDILMGREGTDDLDAGPGNDRLDGGEGGEHPTGQLVGDIARYFFSPARITVNLSTGKVTGGYGKDTIRNIESVLGSNRADVLRGSSGPDLLAGGSGNDDVYGLGGNDTLWGQAGDDDLIGGPGTDTAIGGEGDIDRCAAERRSGCERVLVGAGK